MVFPELQLTYVLGEDGRKHLTIPDDIKASVISFIRENAAKPSADIAAVVQEGEHGRDAPVDRGSPSASSPCPGGGCRHPLPGA